MEQHRAVWEHQAAAVLRKLHRLPTDAPDDAVWEALTAATVEGIPVPPLGLPTGPVAVQDGRRDGRSGGWQVRAAIVDPDPDTAAEAAFDEWRSDADSLWVTVGGAGVEPAVLGRALARVPLDELPVILGPAGSVSEVQAAQAFSDVLRRRDLTPAPGGSLGGDPVGRFLRLGNVRPGSEGLARTSPGVDGLSSRWVQPVIRDLAAVATDLGIGALVADGLPAHDAGAGDVGELGYLLALTVHYLRALESCGYSVPDALRLLHFRLAATDDQFITIAKFRAAGVLLHRISELSGGPRGFAPQVHAVTSDQMMTRYDPWTNLLRTTVAAFAGGVGGATCLTVAPFDSAIGVPSPQGRRLARNISALLIQESHVADVRDPAGGAWAVEALTNDLADAAWQDFLVIEAAGGILAALENGSLATGFARTAAERTARINTRRQPVSGVSGFPLLGESLLLRPPYPAPPPGAPPLRSPSWSAGFESMRDEPGTVPVFVATLGPLAQYTARAGFVANVFTAGGIGAIEAGPTSSVQDVLDAFRTHPSEVVCLAGTDAAYAELGASVIIALRRAGAVRVLLAGRPHPAIAPSVDDHIAVGDDVLEFLRRTRQALSSAPSEVHA